MLGALIKFAAVTPELSLDRLLVGTGGLGILFLLVKVFMGHLVKIDDRHQEDFQELHRTHRDDIKVMRAEHMAERQESREEYRNSLREVVMEIHPRLDHLEEGVKETNRKLDDVGDHLASKN